MRRPAYQREDRGRLDIRMTPMIDVVFQLLVFFVCTMSFQATEEILSTNLSLQAGAGSGQPVDPEIAELEEIVVKLLARDGRTQWLVNDRVYLRLVEVRDVLAASARIRPDLPVILDIESDVPLGDVIDVFDLCQLVGFSKVHFAAKG
jgi:biopolymer transport protein ExbD